MENIAFAQQIIDVNRVATTNAWNVINLIQSQTERSVQAVIDQGNEIAEQGQRILEEWLGDAAGAESAYFRIFPRRYGNGKRRAGNSRRIHVWRWADNIEWAFVRSDTENTSDRPGWRLYPVLLQHPYLPASPR